MRYDMREGEKYPIGFHYGSILNQNNEPLEYYWCLRLPIPFTEHHMRSYVSDCVSMHQCHLVWFRARPISQLAQDTVGYLRNRYLRNRLGFIWANMPEYNYCSTTGQYLRNIKKKGKEILQEMRDDWTSRG